MTTLSPRTGGEEFKDAERALRTYLDSDLPAILRLDGRAFHTYCKGLGRPYDERFMADMDAVAQELACQIDGTRLVFVQSDEISLLLTREGNQEFMFGGQVQKLVSISAAIASTTLNTRRFGAVTDKVALFDSRAFSLPDMDAVTRYFQWRQADARINSLSMLASTHFTHKRLLGKSDRERRVMLGEHGINPHDLPAVFTQGRVVLREPVQKQTTIPHGPRAGEVIDFVRMETYTCAAPPFDEFGLNDEAWY